MFTRENRADRPVGLPFCRACTPKMNRNMEELKSRTLEKRRGERGIEVCCTFVQALSMR